MNILFDFFPLLIFFVVYKAYDIFVATGVLIATTIIQVAYTWIRHRHVQPMHLITLALVIVFGGATILLHDVMFLKWKVSIFNWCFGLAFLYTHFFGSKTLIEYLIAGEINVPRTVWRKLNLIWTAYFVLMGFINLYIAYTFSTEIWVDFKVFGILGLTLLFIIFQSFYLYKQIKAQGKTK